MEIRSCRKEITVNQGQAGKRLDVFLSENYPEISRNVFQYLITSQKVFVNGRKVNKSHILSAGNEIRFEIPLQSEISPAAQDLPIKIAFQDQYLAILSKPAGMVVHPATGHLDGTLVNAILYHLRDINFVSGEGRPGIVHRLDKDTSGLLVVGKNEYAASKLIEMMKAREVTKIYAALVRGHVEPMQGEVDRSIGRSPRNRLRMTVLADGREARTWYEVAARFERYDLLKIRIESGRTHQIRVHMSFMGHPVVGDVIYGGVDENTRKFDLHRQFLHSCFIGFKHPFTGEQVAVWDDLSPELVDFLRKACAYELHEIRAVFGE
ncbi:MAG: RluA family pseudouridine synthase [Actinobacteria bacterium]|nr:RluA family pseudouridine synthase [Actinomycetota bacterium]